MIVLNSECIEIYEDTIPTFKIIHNITGIHH